SSCFEEAMSAMVNVTGLEDPISPCATEVSVILVSHGTLTDRAILDPAVRSWLIGPELFPSPRDSTLAICWSCGQPLAGNFVNLSIQLLKRLVELTAPDAHANQEPACVVAARDGLPSRRIGIMARSPPKREGNMRIPALDGAVYEITDEHRLLATRIHGDDSGCRGYARA
ncbi:hypothetical protein, partial [Parafrankia sp. FMc2]|uniref:hypothetical protein n=1 Tax=Parafrankia sp. FMc2 TaxID=3233196 RepID=UPI0034D57A29